MYFYEVLKLCNEEKLTHEFLELCETSPDIQRTKDRFISFLTSLKKTEPNISEDWTIFVEQEESVDGSVFYAANALRENDPDTYSLEAAPWADTLGCLADKNSVEELGIEVYTAYVLWEMTWFGFDEDSIREKLNKWGIQQVK